MQSGQGRDFQQGSGLCVERARGADPDPGERTWIDSCTRESPIYSAKKRLPAALRGAIGKGRFNSQATQQLAIGLKDPGSDLRSTEIHPHGQCLDTHRSGTRTEHLEDKEQKNE